MSLVFFLRSVSWILFVQFLFLFCFFFLVFKLFANFSYLCEIWIRREILMGCLCWYFQGRRDFWDEKKWKKQKIVRVSLFRHHNKLNEIESYAQIHTFIQHGLWNMGRNLRQVENNIWHLKRAFRWIYCLFFFHGSVILLTYSLYV